MATFLKIIFVLAYLLLTLFAYACCTVAKDHLDDEEQAKWCKRQYENKLMKRQQKMKKREKKRKTSIVHKVP